MWYRAPEVLFGSTLYDCRIDIYSCGLILKELILGRVMYALSRQIEIVLKIFEDKGTPQPEEFEKLRNMYPYLQEI